MKAAILVAAMALVTVMLRFLPFLVFRGKAPDYIAYLGNVLPPAIIGMLVIYCLKDVSLRAAPFGIPELDRRRLRYCAAGVAEELSDQHPHGNRCLYAAHTGDVRLDTPPLLCLIFSYGYYQ